MLKRLLFMPAPHRGLAASPRGAGSRCSSPTTAIEPVNYFAHWAIVLDVTQEKKVHMTCVRASAKNRFFLTHAGLPPWPIRFSAIKSKMGRYATASAPSDASDTSSYDELFDSDSNEEEGEVKEPSPPAAAVSPARREEPPARQVTAARPGHDLETRRTGAVACRLAISFEDLGKNHSAQQRFAVLGDHFYWHELREKASKSEIIVHVTRALVQLRHKKDELSYALLCATMNRMKNEMAEARPRSRGGGIVEIVKHFFLAILPMDSGCAHYAKLRSDGKKPQLVDVEAFWFHLLEMNDCGILLPGGAGGKLSSKELEETFVHWMPARWKEQFQSKFP